jgi:hypothetical protein
MKVKTDYRGAFGITAGKAYQAEQRANPSLLVIEDDNGFSMVITAPSYGVCKWLHGDAEWSEVAECKS